MRIIPRYPFTVGTKHVGCGKHRDRDCLCDVQLSTNNTQIDRTIPHPFFELALNELGDDVVSERNFIELCAVALGAHETFRFREDASHKPLRGGPAEWQALPEEQALALRDHYRVGTPWRIARLELDCVQANSEPIRKYYNASKSWHGRMARSARGAERAARKHAIKCASCGTIIENADARQRMCNAACRMEALRQRRRDRYAQRGQQ